MIDGVISVEKNTTLVLKIVDRIVAAASSESAMRQQSSSNWNQNVSKRIPTIAKSLKKEIENL